MLPSSTRRRCCKRVVGRDVSLERLRILRRRAGRPWTEAAHAGCFSMAFSAQLANAGFPPKRVRTTAAVHFDKVGDAFSISRIDLECEGEVTGIDNAKFQQLAETAKKGCPVSKALAGTQINLKARLVTTAAH